MGVLVGVDVPRAVVPRRRQRRRPDRDRETVVSQIGRAVFGTGPLYYILQLATIGHPDPGREHELRRLSASVVDPRPGRLHAQPVRVPRRAAGVQRRDRGARRHRDRRSSSRSAAGSRRSSRSTRSASSPRSPCRRPGMVRHWLRERGAGWRRSAVINGVGAVATAIVTVIFAVAKFALGAWLIIVIIPVLVGAMVFVHRQYERRRLETDVRPEAIIGLPRRHQRVIVPGPRGHPRRRPGDQVRPDDVRRCHAVHVTDDLDARRASSASASSARSRASRSSSSSRRTASSSGRSSDTWSTWPTQAEDDDRRRAPARVRAAPLVGAIPLQRERPTHPRSAPRPEEHPRRGRPVSAGGLARLVPASAEGRVGELGCRRRIARYGRTR